MMATGFMPGIIALLLFLACTPVLAADVALIGVIGDKAAVLAVEQGGSALELLRALLGELRTEYSRGMTIARAQPSAEAALDKS